jgi:nucleoside-triphosphatase
MPRPARHDIESLKARKILVTGPPRSGKTTLVMRLLERLPGGAGAAGFYTEEIRERGARRGFRLVSLAGEESVLSHVDFGGPHQVGKYGVDVEGFERFLAGISFEGFSLAVMDEIGKMEVLSPRFRELVRRLMASDKTVVATIGLGSHAFMEEVRRTPGARVITLSPNNRDEALEELTRLVLG